VLSHGWTCATTFWTPIARQLAADGYRVVLYDQRGHGRSPAATPTAYSPATLADDLCAVLSATLAPGERAVIGGHSMGGMTIMAFAEIYPEMFDERVVGVALIATSGGLVDETKFGLPALIGRVGGPLLPLVNNATRVTGPAIDRARGAASDLAWLLTRRYGFGTNRPSPALVSYVEKMNSRTSVDTVARYLRTLYTHARYPALAALAHTPALVIVGDKDMITPVTHSETILKHLPDAEFVKVPDSGHVVMLEHSELVDDSLFAFFDKVSG